MITCKNRIIRKKFSILNYRCWVFIYIFLSIVITLEARVDRIEPPSWWTHFHDRRLEIMVYGKNIANTDAVKISDSESNEMNGIKVTAIKKTNNKNYLFIDLVLEINLKPGVYTFSLIGESKTSFDYQFYGQTHNRNYANGFDASDVIYLLMPDRFSNGDMSNDRVDGMLSGTNRSVPGERHGGDFIGIKNKLHYLYDLGITGIWMTPVFENDMPTSYGEYDGQSYGAYHGYAATDLYRVDRRFGTNEDYKELIELSHELGIKVIMDFIHNHVGDHHWWLADLPDSGWFNENNNFRTTNYETVVANDPYASKYDLEQLTSAPFVQAMPDLNQRHPLLSRYLIQHSLWWIEYSGIDGIRMDTYPYAFKDHMAEWAKTVMNEFPDFKIVGEIWANYPPTVAYWQNGFLSPDGYKSNLPSVIDFPFSKAVSSALGKGSHAREIRKVYYTFAQDFIYPMPMDNVIFLDNHDTNRFFTTVGEDIRKYKLGMVLLMVSRGVPQMYYGAEINLFGDRSNGDADIRKDFPGGWLGDQRNAFTETGRTKDENEIWNFCSSLLKWRKNNSTIHQGKTKQFVPTSQHTYTLVRYTETEAVCLLINPTEEIVKVDTDRFVELIKNVKDYKDVMDGKSKKWKKTITIDPVGFRLIEFRI